MRGRQRRARRSGRRPPSAPCGRAPRSCFQPGDFLLRLAARAARLSMPSAASDRLHRFGAIAGHDLHREARRHQFPARFRRRRGEAGRRSGSRPAPSGRGVIERGAAGAPGHAAPFGGAETHPRPRPSSRFETVAARLGRRAGAGVIEPKRCLAAAATARHKGAGWRRRVTPRRAEPRVSIAIGACRARAGLQ